MNKIKTTKAEMKKNYRILSLGYCDMQYLLNYQNAVAYSSGAYGWVCDYYYINEVVISTGYRPINNKNMIEDYEMIRKYEKEASSLNHMMNWEERKEAVNELLFELIENLKQGAIKNETK